MLGEMVDSDVTSPISLYLDLEEGTFPDLEVVARTALAWNSLIKEVIGVLDPSLEVRIEYVSGTRGSATIDNLIRAISKVGREHPLLVGPLITILTIFLLAPINLVADESAKALAKKLGFDDSVEVSDESAQKIAEKVVAIQRNQIAAELKREIYRQAEREPKIIGIGTTKVPTERPVIIVPRSEFQMRSGGAKTEEETVERKTEWIYDYDVVVLRAALEAEERSWRFQHGERKFSAKMRDPEFLLAMKQGHTGLEISAGLEMRLDIKTKLQRRGGVWVEQEISVERVVWPIVDRQMPLEFPPNQDDKLDE